MRRIGSPLAKRERERKTDREKERETEGERRRQNKSVMLVLGVTSGGKREV